ALAAIALAAAGLHALFHLPAGIYPEMDFPRVVVVAHGAQEPPDLVELQLTRPLEQALAVVPGVRQVRARTIRGAAELDVLLAPGEDPVRSEQLCRAAVAGVDLPRDTELEVERVLPTEIPVITFNLGGADPRVLREVAERLVRPQLVRVPGVGGVEVQGGRVREIELELSPAALAGLQLTPGAVADALEKQDRFDSVGRVLDAHQTLPVVLDARPTDLAGLAALPVARGPHGPIPLSAVADLREGAADPDVLVRGPDGEIVVVQLARARGASTVTVVDGARRAIRELVASGALPAGVTITPVYDQAALVEASMGSVRDAILVGVALSLAVIAVFLRDVRAGLVAAAPVPLTLIATFAFMKWTGMTLDLMSLGGLAISIGLVVDDAIVVTEGIVRRLEEGHPPADAADLGTGDLFAAVVGTTMTTVVVFAPLALLSGITGSFLRSLAGTLCIAVLLSMAASLTICPLLARMILVPRRPRAGGDGSAPVERGMRWLLRRRALALVPVVVLVVTGALLAGEVATGFLPPLDEGTFVVDFRLPPGTSLEETDAAARGLDRVLATTPEVVTFTRRTGTEMGPATATLQNEGDIMVRLVARGRRAGIDAVIDRVRERIAAEVPGVQVEFVQLLQDVLGDLAGNPAPIEVHFLGDDPRQLEQVAREAGLRLGKLPELEDLFDGVEGDVPILRATVDRPAAAALGVDAETVSSDLEVALRGRVIGLVPRPGQPVPVRVRLPDATRLDASALERLPIRWGEQPITLGAVVHFDRPAAPSVLRRDALSPAVILTAAVAGGDLGAAEAKVRAVLDGMKLPPGVRYEIGGQAASARDARGELLLVGGLGAGLVLLVLLVQLRSLRLAAIVLLGAPLAVVGALAVLVATGTALDVSSMTGCILLVGLVVKNGILLLEHAQHALAGGAAIDDALAQAARRRTRPIVMTTCATLAGLAPLAAGLGAGSELQRPLAIAVIGGLAVSTAVSILILPGLAGLVVRRKIGP
ncbi:MAG TPA: efflux RND transporter permease subunit, partial [Kofleriaceae bacterium]|nr:efflux RND transporter permease subunit [Kofleriaceae bacterium]